MIELGGWQPSAQVDLEVHFEVLVEVGVVEERSQAETAHVPEQTVAAPVHAQRQTLLVR